MIRVLPGTQKVGTWVPADPRVEPGFRRDDGIGLSVEEGNGAPKS